MAAEVVALGSLFCALADVERTISPRIGTHFDVDLGSYTATIRAAVARHYRRLDWQASLVDSVLSLSCEHITPQQLLRDAKIEVRVTGPTEVWPRAYRGRDQPPKGNPPCA